MDLVEQVRLRHPVGNGGPRRCLSLRQLQLGGAGTGVWGQGEAVGQRGGLQGHRLQCGEGDLGGPLGQGDTAHGPGCVPCLRDDGDRVVGHHLPALNTRQGYGDLGSVAAEQGLLGGFHLRQPEIEPGGLQLEAQRQGIHRQGFGAENHPREPPVGGWHETLRESGGVEILALAVVHRLKGGRLTGQPVRRRAR